MEELEIGGKKYEIKFNHRFYDRVLSDFAKKHKDSDSDGFNNLIAGLIDEDPDAVVRAYRCAIVGKTQPTANDVSDALDEAGFFDNDDVFSDVFKQIKSSGFLAGKIRHLLKLMHDDWKDSEIALKVVSEHADKKAKDYKEKLRTTQLAVAARKEAYELAKKQLAELGK